MVDREFLEKETHGRCDLDKKERGNELKGITIFHIICPMTLSCQDIIGINTNQPISTRLTNVYGGKYNYEIWKNKSGIVLASFHSR